MQDLGTLGGRNSSARGINNNGVVYGVSDVDEHTKGVFLWDAENGMRPIITWSTYYGDTWEPRAINDSGWIVGFTVDGITDQQRAFVWDPAEGFSFLGYGAAWDINNAGQITGDLFAGGPLLWNPIPEPSSLAALGFAIAGLAMAAARRKRR